MMHTAKCRQKSSGAFTLTLPMALAKELNLGEVSQLLFCLAPDGSVSMTVANDRIDEQIAAARAGYHRYRGALRAMSDS